MKIGSFSYINPNFKGDYWTMTDVHGRTPMQCGTLNRMSELIKKSGKKTTLLDNGDNFGRIFKLDATKKILNNFIQVNSDTNVIFNMGNLELYTLTRSFTQKDLEGGYANLTPSQQDKVDYIKLMQKLKNKNENIHFITCFANILEEEHGLIKNLVEPYAIIDDIVEGENKKVLILGTSIGNGQSFSTEDQKKELKKVIEEIKAKEEYYDYAVLLSHNPPNKTNDKSFTEIIDLIEENGIKNLKFVIGGHTHALHDEEYRGKRILFPPASGKGALKIMLNKNEVYAPKLQIKKNAHDFSSLENMNKDWAISNANTKKPIPISEAQEAILSKSFKNYQRQLINMPLTLKAQDYTAKLTNTSELGTFFANSARDITKADFAFFLMSDFREVPPEKGMPLTPYNVKDIINLDKSIWTRDISSKDVKKLFEIALKDQRNPENGCMLEFSDNIRITRRDKSQGEQIKQIEFFENDTWHKLLDKDGEIAKEFENKTFKIATCSQIAKGARFGFEMFKDGKAVDFRDTTGKIYNPKFILEELDPEFKGRIMQSNAFIWGLNNAQREGIDKIEKAKIITI